ncbi:MAG: hypothetical protein KDA89_07135, partial [Planctomycetaceae bacterium]|nr:hypothetical protein [Planctomycetaceae bacterium]
MNSITTAETSLSEERKEAPKGTKLGTARSIIGFELGEADGNLLGFQGGLSVGLGGTAGGVGADIGKTLGTLALTIPDIQLIDQTINQFGQLSASTSSFGAGTVLDDKRQLLGLSVDAGALTGIGGVTETTIGPIGVELRTISYNLEPTLGVNQTISVTPVIKNYVLEVPTGVTVLVNGVNGEIVDGKVTYAPGDVVTVRTSGQMVDVTPSAIIGTRIRNEIGLDIDFDGEFQALSLDVGIFDESVLSVGPLFEHTHDLDEFELGTILVRTFDLPDRVALGETITLGMVEMRPGASPATPLVADQPITFTPSSMSASDMSVFTSVDMINSDGQLNQTLLLEFAGSNVTQIGVIEEGLTLIRVDAQDNATQILSLTPGEFASVTPGTRFVIAGYSQSRLVESMEALVALRFESPDSQVTMRATPLNPTATVVVPPDLQNIPGEVNEELVEQSNAHFEQNTGFDIDGNGRIEPASDGILVSRYLAGVRGSELIRDVIGPGAERTIAPQVERYFTMALDRDLDADGNPVENRLDVDGNGLIEATTDGVLIVRAMAGFTGDALIDNALGTGATRTTPADIISFLRDTSSNIDSTAALSLVDRTRSLRDIVESSETYNPNVASGSTPWVPILVPQSEVFAGTAREVTVGLGTIGLEVAATDRFLKDTSESTDRSQWETLGTVISGDSNRLAIVETHNPSSATERDETSARFFAEPTTRVVGLTTPAYIQLPDAEGYRIRTIGNQQIRSLYVPHDVRGNAAHGETLDVFVPATGTWHVLTMDTAFEFPAPVSEFSIYARVLPDRSYHSNRVTTFNDRDLRLGLIVTDEQADRRLNVLRIGDLRSATLEAASRLDARGIHTFSIVRDQADYRVDRDGATFVFAKSGATDAGLELIGSESGADTITLDLGESGSPLSFPVYINAGGESPGAFIDTVVVAGAGHVIDLTSQFEFEGVEVIDIHGSGSNTLRLDTAALQSNRGTNIELIVRAGIDDNVEFSDADTKLPGDSWRVRDFVSRGGVDYEVWQLERTVGGETRVDPFRVLIELAAGVGEFTPSSFAPSSLARYSVPGVNPRFSGQEVLPDMPTIVATEDVTFVVDLNYQQPNFRTQFLNLQVHYDSRQVSFQDLSDIFSSQFTGLSDGPETVSDGDPTTDRAVELLWYAPSGNWLTGPETLDLAGLQFLTTEAFTGTSIRVTAETSAGRELLSAPVQVVHSGDVDPSNLVVDNPIDEFDGNYSAGNLSLREAIAITNGNPNGATADRIEFSPSVFSSPRIQRLTLGALRITDTVAIVGPGANLLTLDAQQNSRVFEIEGVVGNGSGEDIVIDGLSLINGLTTADNLNGEDTHSGGAIRFVSGEPVGNVPGFMSTGLTVSRSEIRKSGTQGSRTDGGAVYSTGRLNISNSTLDENSAGASGGAISSTGTLMVLNTSVTSNSADFGGG